MTTDSKKHLYKLHELSKYKVSSDDPDVRGWKVKDTDGRTVGKVDNLLVNKNTEKVVYLDVEVDKTVLDAWHKPYGNPAKEGVHEFMNKEGENHLIVPIGMVRLDTGAHTVHSDKITHDTFAKTKRYQKGSDVDREYEIVVFDHYTSSTENHKPGDAFYDRGKFSKT
ncbi:MAG: PRC-barrel domain-containing protein [Leeuwenhoekiella sp.]